MGAVAGAALCLPLLLKILVPNYEFIGWIAGPFLAIIVIASVSAITLSIGLKRLPYMGEA
jgi:hypothetical protein